MLGAFSQVSLTAHRESTEDRFDLFAPAMFTLDLVGVARASERLESFFAGLANKLAHRHISIIHGILAL